jgi:hypothetical protein
MSLKPEYFKPEQLLVGQSYSCDSGLGGSWTIEFTGRSDGRYKFVRHSRPDWPRLEFSYRHEEISGNVYVMCHTMGTLRSYVDDNPIETRRRSRVVMERCDRRHNGDRILVDKETRWLCNDKTDWNDLQWQAKDCVCGCSNAPDSMKCDDCGLNLVD